MDDGDESVFIIVFSNQDRSGPFNCDAVIHLTEDPNTAATTGDYLMTLTGNPSSIRTPRDAIMFCSSGIIFYSIRELVQGTGGPGSDARDVLDIFPNYRPMFMETPHLYSVLPFVCQSHCSLRNWLAIRHRLHRRFMARYVSFGGSDVPFSADSVRALLEEITGFVAFAAIPFQTEGLSMSDKDKIGDAACLLRADRATLELVAQFYNEPLLEEIRVTLGIPISEPVKDRHAVTGFAEIVQNAFLDHVLEPNSTDFVQPEHVTVCFDAQNPIHAREISSYWQVKFRDELYPNLLTLGPWTPGSCCANDGTMEEPTFGVFLPTINGAGPKYDLPRTRECSPDYDVDPVPINTWNAIASTIDNHLLGCTGALFGAFTLDG